MPGALEHLQVSPADPVGEQLAVREGDDAVLGAVEDEGRDGDLVQTVPGVVAPRGRKLGSVAGGIRRETEALRDVLADATGTVFARLPAVALRHRCPGRFLGRHSPAPLDEVQNVALLENTTGHGAIA
jgi:hypothetical protein